MGSYQSAKHSAHKPEKCDCENSSTKLRGTH